MLTIVAGLESDAKAFHRSPNSSRLLSDPTTGFQSQHSRDALATEPSVQQSGRIPRQNLTMTESRASVQLVMILSVHDFVLCSPQIAVRVICLIVVPPFVIEKSACDVNSEKPKISYGVCVRRCDRFRNRHSSGLSIRRCCNGRHALVVANQLDGREHAFVSAVNYRIQMKRRSIWICGRYQAGRD